VNNQPAPADEVAVALSGGGVRAFLFGLGALRAVIRAREQRGFNLSALVAVSGGAIVAAFATSRVDLSSATLADYDEKVLRPAFKTITSRSLMFGAPYLWIVIVIAASCISAPTGIAIFLPCLTFWARTLLPVGGVVLALFVVGFRGWAIERSMAAVLFKGDVPLTSVDGGTRLILQTSDLTSGEATYFTSSGVESYRWGKAPADKVSLVHAARAAATFPGVFPPFRMTGLRFGGGAEKKVPKTIQVVDGGVYDNMASEWLLNEKRTSAAVYKVVINASRNLTERPGNFGIPVLGDVKAFLREHDIQYDATTAPRRRWLIDLFKARAQRGTLVAIDGRPAAWPRSFLGAGDDRAARAAALLQQIENAKAEETWKRWHTNNPAYATSLGRVPRDKAMDLVCAGYFATALQTHILDGWPEPETCNPTELMSWLQSD
jgi:predicted acylesterase/phospholipase RssA